MEGWRKGWREGGKDVKGGQDGWHGKAASHGHLFKKKKKKKKKKLCEVDVNGWMEGG